VITVPGLIDGKEVDGAELFVDLDPSTGEPLARVARLGADEVDRAVGAARRTFDTVARTQSAEVRSGLLHRLVELAPGVDHLFGGWERTGYGREKGFEGSLGYTQTKTVVVGV
jgi:acyl-CoA reductase-like NAD-dependent aldehyde dehydrogenase